METLEEIKANVRLLKKADKIAIQDWLGNLLEDELEFTDEFKAKNEKAESDFRSEAADRQKQLSQSLEKWDAQGAGTIGEKPARARSQIVL